MPCALPSSAIMAPVISTQKVSKGFGLVPLFSEISIAVEDGERVALIGRNGSGKSTLLRILAGLEPPDDGTVTVRKQLSVSYVAQVDTFQADHSAYDALAAVIRPDDSHREQKIGETLGRFGFRDKVQATSAMSGGERKRLAIARGIIAEPDLLLLDEPTNHLDIRGVEWLEQLIVQTRSACVFVSHDRYFIQNVAQRVVELDDRYPGGYFAVAGDYTKFLETRASYLEQLEQYRASLANRVRREVEWLRQGAKARTTKQRARTEQAGELVAELQGLRRVESRAGLEFSSSGRGTKELLKVEAIGKSFGTRPIFHDVSLILAPGSKLGVVGGNGTGKTTLLRTLLGELQPDVGRIVRANKLQVAVLDQLRAVLDHDQTLKQVLAGDGDTVEFNGQRYHVSGWAKRFLFRPEQLLLPVHRLSGGERARALLARIMAQPTDMLVLDEPTNDLDIPTLEVLEEALLEYPGALVLVTHDRYLLDRVCQVVLGMSGWGAAPLFADYRQWERWLAAGVEQREREDLAISGEAVGSERQPLSAAEYKEWKGMEGKISSAENKASAIETLMASPEVASDPSQLSAHCESLAKLHAEIETLYARWSELDARRR